MKHLTILSAVALWGMAISAWCSLPWLFFFCMLALIVAMLGMVRLEVENTNERDRDLGEVLMTRVYRAELRDLKRNKKAVQRGLKKVTKGTERSLRELQRGYNAETRKLKRMLVVAGKAALKALARIDQRIAILEGRLS